MRRLALEARRLMLPAMLQAASILNFPLVFAVVALAGASASADESSAEPRSAIMQAYGEHDADCLEWTDFCATCRRLESGEPACSTPGVACEPSEIVCREKRETAASPPSTK
ncbi:hypothetical protein [Methylocapsa acidiphila]|uniref:hypothetical protein n=1 Tax=Methylocapsa acidiphila TaxID=133552 RepID=UPI0012EB5458|nr:hypothetical protein [Methylocapsa acidiphila]